jgi:hypothetical protein
MVDSKKEGTRYQDLDSKFLINDEYNEHASDTEGGSSVKW